MSWVICKIDERSFIYGSIDNNKKSVSIKDDGWMEERLYSIARSHEDRVHWKGMRGGGGVRYDSKLEY